eukprot:TRINITY_DN8433_c0_g1_i1.p1 TRINITY_DN8433_c0_g1~~TRINITY_DN8433_c0_g1_i1.p1  ORF type:complete len:803 (+),score=197.15 TRINITY_DN8433_c0_g1_i1:28-2409(+)
MDVIVVDFGSEQWKVGWSGKSPTVLPSPAHAVKGGYISNWDAFRGGLMRVFALLNANPEDCSLLYVVPSQFPESSVIQLHHISFEAGVRSVRCVPAPPLALCSEGFSSGIVVDIGATTTSLAAVCEGAILDYVATTKPVGSSVVTERLVQGFRETYSITITPAEALSILKTHGHVAASPTQLQEILDRSRVGALAPVIWKRQDDKTYDVSRLVPTSCEALFEPASGLGLGALAHDVVAKIFSTDFKRYSTIVSAVVLCGGVADLPGLAERMKYELRPWPKLMVSPPTPRKGVFKAWHGGAQLASLPNYQSECTLRGHYSPLRVPFAATLKPHTSAGPVAPVPKVEVSSLAAVPAPAPIPAPDTPKTRELKELRAQQEAMCRELQEIKKGVEWEKLKTDSQFLSFKADMELATLRTGHEVAKTVRAAQEEAVAESRRQAREHAGLVHAVAAAKAGSTEELQRIVQELRRDAEVARRQQIEREETLANAMRQQAALDSTEVRNMVEAVMQQAEATRKQQAESEERLLNVLQCLVKNNPISPARIGTPVQEEYLACNRNVSPSRMSHHSRPPVRSPSPVHSVRKESISPRTSPVPIAPSPQTANTVWRTEESPPRNHVAVASPPPPDSNEATPQASPLRGREGQAVWVHDGGAVEEGTLVGPYEGSNANLVGKDLWWVRINGIKKLKPGHMLKTDATIAGVQQLVEFLDSDLSPKSLRKLKDMRRKFEGSAHDSQASFAYAKAPPQVPPPPTDGKQYENVNPPRPQRHHSPLDDKYSLPPVDFPTDSTHRDFPSAW